MAGYVKTMPRRAKAHVVPFLGARVIVDLGTHALIPSLEAITKGGTIDMAVRIENYLKSVIREAKRLRLITANPHHYLDA